MIGGPEDAEYLDAAGEIRLIAPTRKALDALIMAVEAAHGDRVTFQRPLPARMGWRVYGVLHFLLPIEDTAITPIDGGN